jgi:hypothetical protein
VPDYRLYFLDLDNHIQSVLELDCRDDAHAAETAEGHRDRRAMELWLRDRMIQRFEAKQEV